MIEKFGKADYKKKVLLLSLLFVLLFYIFELINRIDNERQFLKIIIISPLLFE